jgi:spectinomycin phosphotransferase
MLEKQFLSNESIINCLNTDYGLEIATLSFLPLGADMNASVYKAQTYDKRSYFIKLKRFYNHEINIKVSRLLYESGIQQIIHPIHTIYGQQIQQIGDFTLIVYPFIEGQNGFNRDLTQDQWMMLGQTLRQVHEIEVPFIMQNQIRREAYSTTWRNAVRSILHHIEAEPHNDEIALDLVRFMKKNKVMIQRLVNRAEQLSEKIEKLSVPFVLCHADIHGGNVLIDEKNSIYIVDWDEPMMAPKERDLMFIGGGVANVWNKPNEEEFFYKGYGATEINRIILAYYRHERIVEDIALLCQELLLAPVSGADKREMYGQFMDMFEANGVVDIAFRTDEG